MPLGLGGSPYYTPGQFTGPGGFDYGSTPWGQQMAEGSPQTAFYRYIRGLGVADNGSAFTRWVKQQFPDVQMGYNAATISNPYLTIGDYLPTLGGMNDWQRRFQHEAPVLRGESAVNAGAGPVRWIMR